MDYWIMSLLLFRLLFGDDTYGAQEVKGGQWKLVDTTMKRVHWTLVQKNIGNMD